MSNTVGSEVQGLEFARQAELDWLARLDGCQLRTNPLSFGVRSVVRSKFGEKNQMTQGKQSHGEEAIGDP